MKLDVIFHTTGKGMPDAAKAALREQHYLKRIPSVSHAYVGWKDDRIVAVCTFGVPASRELQIGACPSNPNAVLELNRLWVDDCMPRNTESEFLAAVLKALPACIVVSYADTSQGHAGIVYRASNFFYAGWTDMDRKTPRFDYIAPGKHSRDAFRTGYTKKVRRKPKHKYWTVTGDRREKRALLLACGWPKLNWKTSVLGAQP